MVIQPKEQNEINFASSSPSHASGGPGITGKIHPTNPSNISVIDNTSKK
jgi:hypothetical protein